MRADFSPTSAAARLLAGRDAAPKGGPSSRPPLEPRWCEWPRRERSAARGGIWRTLQQIQARHA
jgi:hypothetical protein